MRDIWSFLLQTLTASGAAVLLLVVKAMFRDKLSPRWQFAVWSVLGLVLAFPAGLGGRHALVNWALLLEAAKSLLTGDYGTLIRVNAPVPLLPPSLPGDAAQWLFLFYTAGVWFFLIRYLLAYLRLRRALRRGRPADPAPLEAAAERYGLPACPAVEVEGLSTAFVCGVFRPVLALPAGGEPEEKVLLHELLHLKYRDAAWGLVICLFRCIHWCNPLLWYCAGQAGNDLESLCDQRVLERLEGEERREYGRILLSMADERYACAPGTSSVANGGKNIRRRIEAIARFKRYPSGMALVSVCVALVLAGPLTVGVKAEAGIPGYLSDPLRTVCARTIPCTTPAGAFDAYAKSLLAGEIPYRAMCAPLSEQKALVEACEGNDYDPEWLWRQAGGVDSWLDRQQGYEIYNLSPAGDGAYEGTLALALQYTPGAAIWDGWDGTVHTGWYALQPLRAEKEEGRWVIRPLEDFRAVQGDERMGGNLNLPAWEYTAQAGDFILKLRYQTLSHVDSYQVNSSWIGSSREFLTTPMTDGRFSSKYHTMTQAFYTGSPADKGKYFAIGISTYPLEAGEERPASLRGPGMPNTSGGGSTGEDWAAWELEPGWESPILLSGHGGGGSGGDEDWIYFPPEAYAADFYLNNHRFAELTLTREEGGNPHD